jgi:polysaccharide export outer membrane protein
MRLIICSAVFTLFIHAQAPVRPAPMTDGGANLPAQKVGPNDMIAISVYDSPEFTRTVRVGADGIIRLPMVKQRIKAEGLMPSDLEDKIAEALTDEGILVDPFVIVTIAEYHSRPISVMGAVKMPITFQADIPVTLLDALARAGGLSPEAGPEILISRAQTGPDTAATTLVQRIPVKALINAADPEVNVKLAGGEEIRVPEAGKIYIVGNVHKPGAFTLESGSETTILKAVALSEGLLPFAGKQAFIYRREGGADSKNEIPIELTKIMERKSPDFPLMANDILYIPDNKRQRMTIGALEKLLLIGGGVAGALVYTLRP